MGMISFVRVVDIIHQFWCGTCARKVASPWLVSCRNERVLYRCLNTLLQLFTLAIKAYETLTIVMAKISTL